MVPSAYINMPHRHAGKKAAAAAKRGGPGMPVAAIEAMKSRALTSRAITKDVDRDFKESEAGPDAKTKAHRQSKMLEALFEIYFRCGLYPVSFPSAQITSSCILASLTSHP